MATADPQPTTPIQAGPKVSAADRLGFTIFVALAIHAVIVLGIGFMPDEPPTAAKTLEITLAHFESEDAPEKADYLAQSNQLGSGESEQKDEPTTRQQSVFKANNTEPVAADLPSIAKADQHTPSVSENTEVVKEAEPTPPKPKAQPKEIKQEVVKTESETARNTVTEQVEKTEPSASPKPNTGTTSSLLARSLEIAALQARIDQNNAAIAKRPRVLRLTSASTMASNHAAYLNTWQRKVERIGNLNYPEEAHRRRLYGELRLLVVVQPDGKLDRVEILKSSGHQLLDDAAKNIVFLSAPFSPFPQEMRKQYDVLEIIRTWRFEKANFGLGG